MFNYNKICDFYQLKKLFVFQMFPFVTASNIFKNRFNNFNLIRIVIFWRFSLNEIGSQ